MSRLIIWFKTHDYRDAITTKVLQQDLCSRFMIKCKSILHLQTNRQQHNKHNCVPLQNMQMAIYQHSQVSICDYTMA
jgi:hypothetical protein